MPPRKRKYKARFEPKASDTELASTSYFENLAAHSSNATTETAAAITELNEELDVEDTSALFIQAYEATVLRGAQALDSARALEVFPGGGGPGDALVKWSSGETSVNRRWRDDDDDEPNSGPGAAISEDIWIDRYVTVFQSCFTRLYANISLRRCQRFVDVSSILLLPRN